MQILRRLLFVFLVGLTLQAALASAQSDNSSITGTITDSTGAVVPHATVNITNEATGQARTLSSNDTGFYATTNLPPGNYTVNATAQGFQSFTQTHNHLEPSIPLRVDATLSVGASATTVNVVADASAQFSASLRTARMPAPEELWAQRGRV